jgi:hypothetical protein
MINKEYNFLAPVIVNDLIRVGSKNDGGYIMSSKVLKNCNFLLSFGLGDDWSLEKYFLRKENNLVHIYDHTVNYYVFIKRIYKSFKRLFYFKSNLYKIIASIRKIFDFYNINLNKRFIFFKKKVSILSSEKEENLRKIFSKIPKNSKILFSIDIEGDEFNVLNNIYDYAHQIHGMSIEFHYLKKNKKKFKLIVKKLQKYFYIIHIHGNNYNGVLESGLPEVLEISFMNKKIYKQKKIQLRKSLPLKKLDQPNVQNKKQIEINFSL